MPCDLACQTKIILNGDRVESETRSAVKLADRLTEEEAYQLIAILDEAEDKLIEFNNRTLGGTGYKRRTPKFKLD